jgi:hypothetical protein
VNGEKLDWGGVMARKKRKPPEFQVNKTELKCIIIRFYGNQKKFACKHGLNHGTLKHYINGRNMPKIDKIIVPIMRQHGYYEDGTPVIEHDPMISPDLQLQIAANNR